MTLELKRALKAHKADTLYLLALPEHAKLGAEVKQPRCKIGEMAHTEEEQWELSESLDPRWPPSMGVDKRISRKETSLWESEAQA